MPILKTATVLSILSESPAGRGKRKFNNVNPADLATKSASIGKLKSFLILIDRSTFSKKLVLSTPVTNVDENRLLLAFLVMKPEYESTESPSLLTKNK